MVFIQVPAFVSLFLAFQQGFASPAQGSEIVSRREGEFSMPPLARELDLNIFADSTDPPAINNITGSSDDLTACKNICQTFADDTNACNKQVSCICTQKIVDDIAGCLDCAVALNPNNQTVQDAAQKYTDLVVQGCNDKGYSVSSHKIVASTTGIPSGSMAVTAGLSGIFFAVAFVGMML